MTTVETPVYNWYIDAQRWLTPKPEQQIKLVLEGKCPHNQGWDFHSFGHNDRIFKCSNCGEFGSY